MVVEGDEWTRAFGCQICELCYDDGSIVYSAPAWNKMEAQSESQSMVWPFEEEYKKR